MHPARSELRRLDCDENHPSPATVDLLKQERVFEDLDLDVVTDDMLGDQHGPHVVWQGALPGGG
ncbi:hypothetical protein DFR50_10283 [Roseiarcus fermentans]|uniref:Uncharacterized protein n=1 Tax=Roseiarcus fermentans TaxID=1473586 RepID=A0A366FST5_9HYPH|nr:hypothetical protein [Roseiarcus fermentans]RBP17591.1 hypothetical protein DFR50_10283 [Roseiarcus fermentans]